MNHSKQRLICSVMFVILNFIYGGLVVAGYVGPVEALLYGAAGLLWAMKLRNSRHQYRRHLKR